MEQAPDITSPLGRYEMMLLIRRFEERVDHVFAEGVVHGTAHLSIGQEACAVGAVAATQPSDPIVSSHRGHGHFLARCADPEGLMGEILGKATGPCQGRGGSQHLCAVQHAFYGTNGITGGGIPTATGLALGQKLAATGRVVLCFFGDGAVNQGEFHESLNLAAIWHLPVVFLCENNLYGMGTDIRRVSAEVEVYRRACAYNIPAEQADGMEVLDVRDAVRKAVQHTRDGRGPYFVEAVTYRFRGHSMADPEFYRTKEEVQQWRARDPIPLFERRLRDWRLIDDAGIKRLEDEVEGVVNEAERFAEESPAPDVSTLYDNVYEE